MVKSQRHVSACSALVQLFAYGMKELQIVGDGRAPVAERI